MTEVLVDTTRAAVDAFCGWLDRFGETSYDHQSFFASKLGRSAKALYYRKPVLGTLAVSPMIFCEAFLPTARKLFWKPQRFPIADAHYAMGFAFLATLTGEDHYYRRAVHFLEILKETRCRGYQDYCWGYPFDWQTRTGPMTEGTPLITTVPYAYEAFSQVYAIDGDGKWLAIMRSIADHALHGYRDVPTGPGSASCGYTPSPNDPGGVINASAYRAFLLTKAAIELTEPKYLEKAQHNLNFVLQAQKPDGCWYYSTDAERDFVDHFHTCFVLKALTKIELLTGSAGCRGAIERGVEYYVKNLVDADGLPLPFSKRPRLTVYRHELYDYAESINLATLLYGRFPGLDRMLSCEVSDVMRRWRKGDGSFRARQLLIGWDNVPMHRWAQSQMFRSLCQLLCQRSGRSRDGLGDRVQEAKLQTGHRPAMIVTGQ
jgi:hypothetical protein